MKQLVSFEEYVEEGEKFAFLEVFGFALYPREHKKALSELEAEGIHITQIDADSCRGELKQRYAIVKTALNALTAKGWTWNEED